MDLLQQVVANLGLEEGTAEKGIGAMLVALRMTMPQADFDPKQRAYDLRHDSAGLEDAAALWVDLAQALDAA